MKKLVLPFALGLALVSCSRDNDNNETPAAELPVLPTKTHYTFEDKSTDDVQFSYNGDKISEINIVHKDNKGNNVDTTKFSFTYTGDQITSQKDANSVTTYT